MCFTRIGSCIGNFLYVLEKLASCCALTAVITCLITTLILMLAFGIGLGYNYCFVDLKTRGNENATTKPAPKSLPKHAGRGRGKKRELVELGLPDPSRSPRKYLDRPQAISSSPIMTRQTVIVPLNMSVDFPSLLAKIRALNKNVTLEIVVP